MTIGMKMMLNFKNKHHMMEVHIFFARFEVSSWSELLQVGLTRLRDDRKFIIGDGKTGKLTLTT